MNRRKFIEQSGRGLFLGGLALVSIVAVSREGFNGETCDGDFVCNKCKKLNSCRLPEAKEIKDE